MDVKKVCVIGTGTMGRGITQVLASSGYEVNLRSRSLLSVQRGVEAVKKSMEVAIKRGKISKEDLDEAILRIKRCVKLEEAVKGVDLVIEAVPEDMELKKSIFKRLDEICREKTILSSNTSSLSITKLASAVKRQDKFVGFHWFNPTYAMKLIEVVKGINTSDETVDKIVKISKRCGKTPVIVNDTPGFVATRAHSAFVLEAIRILQEGVATPEAIDAVAKLGFNHPMGPLELADLIGLDVALHYYEYLEREHGDRFKPPTLLKNLVNAGHLGRKIGKGFYDYNE